MHEEKIVFHAPTNIEKDFINFLNKWIKWT